MFMNRNCLTALLSIVAMVIISACPTRAAAATVAEVNGEEISESEFIETLKNRYGYIVLQSMIEALAIRQEADERGIVIAPEQVNARYQQAQQQIVNRTRSSGPPDEVFAAWLAQQHINAEVFRERIELQMMLEAMVGDKAKVSEEELRGYYDSHQADLQRPEAMKISHICVTTPEKAEEIRSDIVAGRITFAEAARRYSIDPYGRDNEGLIGFVVRGEDPLQQAAFQLTQDGEISPVIHTQMGYHILRREAYQEQATPPFEEIREELKKHLSQAKLMQLADEMRQAILRTAQVNQHIQFPSPTQVSSSVAAP